MAVTNGVKHSGSVTNGTAHTGVFSQFLRHGKDPDLLTLANYTFTSVIFADGTVLQNATFDQLADAVITNQTKH